MAIQTSWLINKAGENCGYCASEKGHRHKIIYPDHLENYEQILENGFINVRAEPLPVEIRKRRSELEKIIHKIGKTIQPFTYHS